MATGKWADVLPPVTAQVVPGEKFNFVGDEIVVSISALPPDAEASAEKLYEMVRQCLNQRFPKAKLESLAGSGRTATLWTFVPSDSGSREAVFVYRSSNTQPDDPDMAILAESINAELIQTGTPIGLPDPCGQLEAASANWLIISAAEHDTGCPGSRSDPASSNVPSQFKFTYDYLNQAKSQAAGDDVVVAVLDTCPNDPITIPVTTNRLLEAVRARVSAGRIVLPGPAQGNLYVTQHDAKPEPRMSRDRTPNWHLDPAWFPSRVDTGPSTGGDWEIADHGIFVTGIIADIAPAAQIHLIRALGPYGAGRMDRLINLLYKLPGELNPGGARKLIVSLSLVASMPANPLLPFSYHHVLLQRAIRWLAAQPKVLIVSSAGNDNNMSVPDNLGGLPRYPGRFPEALCVASVNKLGQRSWFSDQATAGDKDRATGITNLFSPTPVPLAMLENGIATYGGDARQATYVHPSGNEPHGPPFIDLAAPDIDGVVGIVLTPGKLPLHGKTRPDPDSPFQPNPSNPTQTRDNTSNWAYWAGTSFATPTISAIAANLWSASSAAISTPAAITSGQPSALDSPIDASGAWRTSNIRTALQEVAVVAGGTTPSAVAASIGANVIQSTQV